MTGWQPHTHPLPWLHEQWNREWPSISDVNRARRNSVTFCCCGSLPSWVVNVARQTAVRTYRQAKQKPTTLAWPHAMPQNNGKGKKLLLYIPLRRRYSEWSTPAQHETQLLAMTTLPDIEWEKPSFPNLVFKSHHHTEFPLINWWKKTRACWLLSQLAVIRWLFVSCARVWNSFAKFFSPIPLSLRFMCKSHIIAISIYLYSFPFPLPPPSLQPLSSYVFAIPLTP